MRQITAGTLGQLYCQHAAALLLFARQFGDCAEDVVQEAFIKLATVAPPPEQVVPWLYRVVRNEAIAAKRSWFRRRRREQRVGGTEIWFANVDDLLDAKTATAALADLSLEVREIIVARLWSGLTFEQIAELVDSPLTTVHRRYREGLAALREKLEGSCSRTTGPTKA